MKNETEKAFESIIQKAMLQNQDPMLGAMLCYNSVLKAGRIFKRDFIKLAEFSHFSELEINSVVDEVQNRILKKYFEDFE